MNSWLALIAGFAVGAVGVWLWAKAQMAGPLAAARIEAEGKIQSAEGALRELRAQVAETQALRERLDAEQRARVVAETRLDQAQASLAEQRRLLDDAQTQLADTFRALATEALKSNDQHFITLAKSTFETIQAQAKGDLETRQKEIGAIIAPLKESLSRYEQQVLEMEKTRQNAYGSLDKQLQYLASINEQLQKETGTLANALKGGPQVRGRWGEMTLRRAAELAGMAEHCDFEEQETFNTEAGRLRPDMVVHLPGGRRIAVDAKAPLEAFIKAASATSEAGRLEELKRHARLVRDHMNKLASKAYWEQFEEAPEIVVLFLPGESFFSAALEQDFSLIDDAMQKHVVLSTPTTFVALLKAVAYGWRQESIAQNAREISELGKQLYDRLGIFLGHFTSVGAALGRAVESYNKATGSLESRVLVQARRFKELGVTGGEEIEQASPIEATPRELAVPEAPEGD